MELDWHRDRSDLLELALLDELDANEPIDLVAVRAYRLGQVAYEQVHYNIELLRPGVTFREYSEKAWTIPDRYVANRYFVSAHGCGMTGEYPYLYHGMDFADSGYDGVIEAGMTLCVESYIGDEGGHEGVKLEQQLVITDPGPELLSSFPFESALLGQTT